MRYFLMGYAEDDTPVELALTVRVRNGRLSVTGGSGPAPGEQLREIVLIDARDLNEAIQVASRLPWARLGGVEVRPVASRGETE